MMHPLVLLLICLAGALDAGSRAKPFGAATWATLMYLAALVIVLVTWAR